METVQSQLAMGKFDVSQNSVFENLKIKPVFKMGLKKRGNILYA